MRSQRFIIARDREAALRVYPGYLTIVPTEFWFTISTIIRYAMSRDEREWQEDDSLHLGDSTTYLAFIIHLRLTFLQLVSFCLAYRCENISRQIYKWKVSSKSVTVLLEIRWKTEKCTEKALTCFSEIELKRKVSWLNWKSGKCSQNALRFFWDFRTIGA